MKSPVPTTATTDGVSPDPAGEVPEGSRSGPRPCRAQPVSEEGEQGGEERQPGQDGDHHHPDPTDRQ